MIGAALFRGRRKDRRKRARSGRKLVIEILDVKLSTPALDLDFAPREDPAIMISENRNQQLVAELLFVRLPVDIEVDGVTAGRPIFEHVPPEAVTAAADRHMIRNNVQDLAKTARTEPE